jgi:hypothetical protein
MMKYIWKTQDNYLETMVYTAFVNLHNMLLELNRLSHDAPYSKWIGYREIYYQRNSKYPEEWQEWRQAIFNICDNLNQFSTREEAAAMLIIGFVVPESELEPWLKT